MNNFVTRVLGAKIEEPREARLGPYVDLMIDRNFKLFFGSQKRKDLLLALLQEFLPELNIVSVELGPQEHIGRDEGLTNRYTFALVHDEDWSEAEVISSYTIREDGNFEKMTEALHFRYVELGRFDKKEEELKSVRDWWLYILKNAGSLSDELQIRLSEGGDVDKNEKTEYYKNMRNAFDIKSEKWFAREEGKAEGKAEVAKELKAIGINPDQIAQATGLSIEAVAAL